MIATAIKTSDTPNWESSAVYTSIPTASTLSAHEETLDDLHAEVEEILQVDFSNGATFSFYSEFEYVSSKLYKFLYVTDLGNFEYDSTALKTAQSRLFAKKAEYDCAPKKSCIVYI